MAGQTRDSGLAEKKSLPGGEISNAGVWLGDDATECRECDSAGKGGDGLLPRTVVIFGDSLSAVNESIVHSVLASIGRMASVSLD